jgi:hypothetical protein
MNDVDRDERNVKRCPKCDDVMGTNIEDKPICFVQCRRDRKNTIQKLVAVNTGAMICGRVVT